MSRKWNQADFGFQPTLPARGATVGFDESIVTDLISTHTPRTGSDDFFQVEQEFPEKFQPTLPARGATIMDYVMEELGVISTHTPRTGSD